MQTLVKIKDEKWGFTFMTFYGRWQKKHAKDMVERLKNDGYEAEVL